MRISRKQSEETIDLLLLSNDEGSHYCWIKSMSRLLSSQVSGKQHTREFCRRCLNNFHNKEALDKHQEFCSNHEAVKTVMPEHGTILKFRHFSHSMRVPFVVYADFECFTEPVSGCMPASDCSSTTKYQSHKPSGFSFLIKCFDDSIFAPILVSQTAESPSSNIPQLFIERLEEEIVDLYGKFKFAKKMVMSPKDRLVYQNAQECHICGGRLGNDRVRDRCHLTGKFRGAAHNKYNLDYRLPKFFPVIFHNLSGYDSHLFIKNLGKTEGKIDCIPTNEEKYISFTKEIVVDSFIDKDGNTRQVKRDLRFIDSFKFMACSLESLVKNLPKESFKNLPACHENPEAIELVMRKGVFPYDWFDSFDKLSETGLPPIEAFYSKLNGTHISEEDWSHAQKVWEAFDMCNMRDYHDLYFETDVLLLADVFENFRDVCMRNYNLDPAWYYTAPGLAWDAALKINDVKLELLSDPNMLLMIEEGIRGGISIISTRYGAANNSYMGEKFDASKPTKYITYLDANNLYGWAMSEPLPTHGFRWMDDQELKPKVWKSIPCILEVDLEYPHHLHNLHNDYPLAPERVKIDGVEKLIPNLNDKTKYTVHHETLKQYEGLGLKITKIHRGITFEESAWLGPYIELNTDLRSEATNDFEKDFFKLMNNSVFGKTMENIRNRVDIRLVTNERDARKLISKPNFQGRTIFDENLVAIHMKKTKLVFNKPIYLGMRILDLSKTLMYDFHYKYIKPKYPNGRAKLLFTDTDSLMYEIETDDFYKDILSDVHDLFDTSNYLPDHPSGIPVGVNKKIIGMFKDEAGGKQITEFVGLRAKLYSFRMNDEVEEKKCKGVKNAVVKNTISFQDYKDCLFNKQPQMRKMNVIRSHLHEIFTETVNKIALSHEDDKRIIREDGINTFAHGYFRTLSGGSIASPSMT